MCGTVGSRVYRFCGRILNMVGKFLLYEGLQYLSYRYAIFLLLLFFSDISHLMSKHAKVSCWRSDLIYVLLNSVIFLVVVQESAHGWVDFSSTERGHQDIINDTVTCAVRSILDIYRHN